MTFGQRLRSIRKNRNATQADVESTTGIPQTTLSRWETDKAEPVASDIVKLAAALGVTIAELLDATDQQAACLPKTG